MLCSCCGSGRICHLVHTTLYFRVYTTTRSIMILSVNYMALGVTDCLWDVTYSSKCQVSVLAFFENKAQTHTAGYCEVQHKEAPDTGEGNVKQNES